jgi:hypothetical protein
MELLRKALAPNFKYIIVMVQKFGAPGRCGD